MRLMFIDLPCGGVEKTNTIQNKTLPNKEMPLKKHIVIVHAVLLFLLIQTLWPQERSFIPPSPPGITTIIIVRHAEKDTTKTDPPLTPQGKERARLLAHILRSSGVVAIYSTQYIRTEQTVQPIAESLHLKPQIFTINPDKIEEHAATLVSTILRERVGNVVLIASHSNVIPLLLRDMGIAAKITIGDLEYDNLFIVTTTIDGGANLLRLRYGRN